jgi:hypothetical protein
MEINSQKLFDELNLELREIKKELVSSSDLSHQNLSQLCDDLRKTLKEINQINGEIGKLRKDKFTLASEITSSISNGNWDKACRDEAYTEKLFGLLQSVQKEISFTVKIMLFIAVLNSFALVKLIGS